MLELDKIYNMDCIEGMKQIDDNSIDLVLTDPPYGINKKGINNDESLGIYYNVLPEIYRVMKMNSWFVTFCSIARLPDMFNYNHFKYSWCGFIYYRNREKICRCKMGSSKQSLFIVFEKGNPKRHNFSSDVLEYVYSKNINYGHPARKPTKCISQLIKCFSKENDTVLDCFMGSGTTALACKRLNRHFIGFEINKEYYDISLKRLLNVPERLENWIEM